MMWKRARLSGRIEVGKDKMGNPVTQTTELGTAIVRETPWGIAKNATEGNPFTSLSQMFATRKPPEHFKGVTHIEVGGAIYALDRVSRPRYTLLSVTKVRP